MSALLGTLTKYFLFCIFFLIQQFVLSISNCICNTSNQHLQDKCLCNYIRSNSTSAFKRRLCRHRFERKWTLVKTFDCKEKCNLFFCLDKVEDRLLIYRFN